MASRLPALDPAYIYFCPTFPSHRQSKVPPRFRSDPNPHFLTGLLGLLHDLPKPGLAAGAGAAAHPVPQKHPSAEAETAAPCLGQ